MGASPPQFFPSPLSGANYSQALQAVRLRRLLPQLADRDARGHGAGADLRRRWPGTRWAGCRCGASSPLMVTLLIISLFPAIARDRAAVPAAEEPRLAEQLPGADRPVHGVQPAVRHLDHAQLHARHPQGDGGDRPDRRRRAAADGLDDHLADGAAGRLHGGHLLLHRLLDRVPDGADLQQRQQLQDHPGRHRDVRHGAGRSRTGPSSPPAWWRWCPSASWSSSSASS